MDHVMTDENPDPGPMGDALRSCGFAVSNINDAESSTQLMLVSAKDHIRQVEEKVTALAIALRTLASCYDEESKVVGSHHSRSTVLSEAASDIRTILRGEENDLGPTFHQEAAKLVRPNELVVRIDAYLQGPSSEDHNLDHSNGCDLLAEARTALAGLIDKPSCDHCDLATNGAHEYNCQAHPDHPDKRPPAPICPDCSGAVAAVDGCRPPREGERECDC